MENLDGNKLEQSDQVLQKLADLTENVVQNKAQKSNDKYDFGWNSPSQTFGEKKPEEKSSPSNNGKTSSNNHQSTKTNTNINQKYDEYGQKISSVEKSGKAIATEGEDGSHGPGKSRVIGTYNTSHIDMTSAANALIDASKASVSESDLSHGVSYSKKVSVNLGAGVALGSIVSNSQKATVAEKFASETFSKNVEGTDIQTLFGGKYHAGSMSTGNALKDYSANIKLVEEYLEKNGINAKNLNLIEIKYALHKGELSHLLHMGGNIKIPSGGELEMVLKEYANLKAMSGQMNQIKKASGSFGKFGRSWLQSSIEETDAGKGVQATKIGMSVTKAGGWAAKGIAGAGVNTAVTMGGATAKVGIGSAQLGTKIAKITVGNDVDKLKKINVIDSKLHKASNKVNVVEKGVKKQVNNFVKTSASSKLGILIRKSPVGKAFAKFGARFDPLKLKMANMKKFMLKHTKIARAPFNFASKLGRIVSKILITCGGIFLIVIIIDVIILLLSSIFPESSERDSLINYEKSIAQQTVDYLYSYQRAYSENIFRCERGSEWFEKGIPDSWKDQMHYEQYEIAPHTLGGEDSTRIGQIGISTDGTIEDELTAVKDGGVIKGYNLKHYWGPEVVKYKAPVDTWRWVECDVYDDEGNKTGTEWRWITIKKPMTIIGIGGLEGHFGDYEWPDVVHKNGPYGPLEGIKAPKSLNNGKENQNIEVIFSYKGSEYSYLYTGEKTTTEKAGSETVGGKYSGYINSEEKYVQYDIETLYKAFLSMMHAYTDGTVGNVYKNEAKTNTNLEYTEAYTKRIFDKVMDGAKLTIKTRFVPDSSLHVTWHYEETNDEGGFCETDVEITGFSPYVTIKVLLDDTGLADMVQIDSFEGTPLTTQLTTNEWAHADPGSGNDIKPNGSIYSIRNERNREYKKWIGWLNPDGVNDNKISQYYEPAFHGSGKGAGQYATTAYEMALSYYELSTDEFEEAFQGIVIPKEIFNVGFIDSAEMLNTDGENAANLTEEKIQEIIESLKVYHPDGSVTIDMSKFYLNQGDSRWAALERYIRENGSTSTIRNSACCDMSYMMIWQAITGNQLSTNDVISIVNRYVNAAGMFDSTSFLSDYGGVTPVTNPDTGNYNFSFSQTGIQQQLDEGKPVVLHIKGSWTYDGQTYHSTSNGHFLTITGYTESGFIVSDPGSSKNSTLTNGIPYEAFAYVDDLYYRQFE